MWTPKVYAALKLLEQYAEQNWLVDQFREGLQNKALKADRCTNATLRSSIV
jgi:hypothetical protein